MKQLDPELLQEITRRLVAELQPEEVILFGSHAWGIPDRDSDLDLLVIVSESDLPPTKRATRAYRSLRGVLAPVDILVKTRGEIERYRHVRASLERAIIEKGRCFMDEAKQELVRSWLTKALHDLGAARRISTDASEPDTFLDTAIYHCQQAAEKAMKAFLVFHDQEFEKTHDVRQLVSLAATVDPRFSEWDEAAEDLTPYAVAYRYPGSAMDPDRNEFD